MNVLIPKGALSRGYILAIGLLAITCSVAAGAWTWWRTLPKRLMQRSEVALQQGRLRDASRDLESYVARKPDDTRARMMLARCYLDQGGRDRLEAAVRHLDQILDADPLAAESRVKSADILLLGLGRAAEAERYYRKAIEVEPINLEARQGLFQIYWWQGRRTAEQVKWLEEMWQLGTPKYRMSALSQMFLWRYGEFPADKAAAMMEGFLREDTRDYGARVGLAHCMYRQKRYEEAVRLARECLKERPDDPVTRAMLVQHAIDHGDWTAAGQDVENWPEAARDLNYWTLKGQYLQEGERKFSEAAECFERALAFRPDRWSTRYRLSQCLEAIGEQARASTERERSDRIGKALVDTRVKHLLEQVISNLGSRPQGCYEMAEFLEEVGLEDESHRWRRLAEELGGSAGTQPLSADQPSGKS